MDIAYAPELRLGRFTAYLARVLLTKLEDPNSPRQLRDHITLTIYFKAGYTRYRQGTYQQLLTNRLRMTQNYVLYWPQTPKLFPRKI